MGEALLPRAFASESEVHRYLPKTAFIILLPLCRVNSCEACLETLVSRGQIPVVGKWCNRAGGDVGRRTAPGRRSKRQKQREAKERARAKQGRLVKKRKQA